MSGRRNSLSPQTTMNIGSCRMAFTPLLCHRIHRQYPDLLPEPGRTPRGLLHYSHLEPQLPFIVEVGSTIGVGAVLSQYHGDPPRLHPCAYFSRKLSPAERNYDIGNQELLAIKMALEEWRHWLEGAQHPFTSSRTTRTLNISEVPRG